MKFQLQQERTVVGIFSMRIVFSLLIASVLVLPSVSKADILTIIIDPSSLSYDLGPSKYDNSPSNYDNSSSKYDNSESNYDNSPSKYDNSASKYDNRFGGDRDIVTEDGKAIGYYVFGESGIINFFNYNSRRVAYLPSGGHTRSVFTEEGWCGTLGEIRGELALGITQSCYYAFLLLD
jgi:hypothetical protein